MKQPIKIGTRESELAVWQATLVKNLLEKTGVESELIYIQSEGDLDVVTPLYQLGVQGIFTKTLDAALLNKRIDIAVHSMKDVPTQLAKGITQAAVLKRGSYKDIFVPHPDLSETNIFRTSHSHTSGLGKTPENKFTIPLWEPYDKSEPQQIIIATSSVRRKAQWLNRMKHDRIENLRGNVNTRLRKLKESNWHGAIFAAAGLERINLRPKNSIDLDWMLPAPSQGAIMIVCRDEDDTILKMCATLNDEETAMCTKIEKDFLRVLMGGCSTPIGALAIKKMDKIIFKGNICSLDGKEIINLEKEILISELENAGTIAGKEILQMGGSPIIEKIHNTRS